MTPIAFFDENIAIHAHSASHSEHLKTIRLKEFTQDSTERVSLYQVGDELYARKSNGDFIQGKEAA